MVARYGLTLQATYQLDKRSTKEDFLPYALHMSRPEENPDVVVTCTYEVVCAEWMAALREAKWSLKAQVFNIYIGFAKF